jgi:cell division transport system ATP-binding protein
MHEILKEMPHGVKSLLEKKYNIIDHLIFIDFDNDFLKLSRYLRNIKKEKFDWHDRIIIEHMDTDFYFPGSTVGINLINFFNVIKDLDYPYFVFMFYTNHFGITREIDLLCQDTDPIDRPTVIESFITNFHYNNNGYTNINLNIEQCEFVFLFGQSCSGKSSLLRLLLKEEKPSSGIVTVDGINVAKLPNRKVPAFRRTMGIVFQDFRLLPGKTVFDNVAFGMEVIGKSKKEIQQRIPAILELVGLEEKAHRLPSELSGGEQQRVALARAFVNKPKLLLADEPTGNLDPSTSGGIMKLLDRINRTGTTIVMATHDVAIVDQMRKRIVQMENGKIIRDQERGMYGHTGQ